MGKGGVAVNRPREQVTLADVASHLAQDRQLGIILDAFGHDRHAKVVGECIEDNAQLQILREMGCDFGQGYLFARPLDREATFTLLTCLAGEPPR